MCSSGGVGGVEQLEGALDALAAADLAVAPPRAVLERTRALVAARARIDAELARTVRRAEVAQAPEEDGLRSMTSWLRGHCRVSTGGAGGLVRAGRALERLLGLAAAHAAGAVTAEHVAAIAPVAADRALSLAAEQGVDLAAVEQTLTAYAAEHGPADTARLVHAYLDRLDADGPEPDPTVGRSCTVATHPDGRVTGRFDLEDLLDPSRGPAAAENGFGATLSAARARWAACDADVTRIVLGPEGQPLDVGRTHRLVPAWLRKAVEQRDGGCVFAGCGARTWWCEVHHLVAWAFGGETSLENSGLLCERHHTQVHHGFTVERGEDGVWHTYRADGSEILVGPRPWLDPGGGPAPADEQRREGWALAGAFP